MGANMVVATAIKKRNVLVCIKFDSQSKDLLDWALVKVAEPGDSVIAVHVCRCSSHVLKRKPVLDSYLEAYEGLCSLKKVELNGQILTGISIRKTLVKEAKKHAAVAVILGTSRQTSLVERSSKAAYCATRLPATTDVFSVHNGKVVFQRCSNYQLPGLGGDPRPSRNLLARDVQSKFGEPEADTEISSFDVLTRDGSGGDSEDNSLVFESRTRSMSPFAGDILDERPGWPLLRRKPSAKSSALRLKKLSVVQWAMSLPDRFPRNIYASSMESPLQRRNDCLSKQRIKLGYLLSSDILNELEILLRTNSTSCRWYKYEVLETISNFSAENLIGRGGCNNVYKGILPDGKQVAIKMRKSSREAKKDFAREVEIITSLSHKHIKPLLGISITDADLISVYDFSSEGSLEDNLHGKNSGKSALPWEARFSIAGKIAEALNYLHNEYAQPVIHRDIKSSNILLSDGYEPQLSDFGLAMWGPQPAEFAIEEDVVGTFGYLAPEYFMFGKISYKIDVYAFGIVLLELLTGRKPIDSDSPKGQESLLMWAKPMIEKGNTIGILDPNLAGKFDEDQVERMVLAASLCTKTAARLRPNMTEVLKILRGNKEVDKLIKYQEIQDEYDYDDEEVYTNSTAKLHINLAMLDIDDDSTSFSSLEHEKNPYFEEYLKEIEQNIKL